MAITLGAHIKYTHLGGVVSGFRLVSLVNVGDEHKDKSCYCCPPSSSSSESLLCLNPNGGNAIKLASILIHSTSDLDTNWRTPSPNVNEHGKSTSTALLGRRLESRL